MARVRGSLRAAAPPRARANNNVPMRNHPIAHRSRPTDQRSPSPENDPEEDHDELPDVPPPLDPNVSHDPFLRPRALIENMYARRPFSYAENAFIPFNNALNIKEPRYETEGVQVSERKPRRPPRRPDAATVDFMLQVDSNKNAPPALFEEHEARRARGYELKEGRQIRTDSYKAEGKFGEYGVQIVKKNAGTMDYELPKAQQQKQELGKDSVSPAIPPADKDKDDHGDPDVLHLGGHPIDRYSSYHSIQQQDQKFNQFRFTDAKRAGMYNHRMQVHVALRRNYLCGLPPANYSRIRKQSCMDTTLPILGKDKEEAECQRLATRIAAKSKIHGENTNGRIVEDVQRDGLLYERVKVMEKSSGANVPVLEEGVMYGSSEDILEPIGYERLPRYPAFLEGGLDGVDLTGDVEMSG